MRNSGEPASTMPGSIHGIAERYNHTASTRTATAIAGQVRPDIGIPKDSRAGSRRSKEHVIAVAIRAADRILSVAYDLAPGSKSSGPLKNTQALGRYVQARTKKDDSVMTNQGNATKPAIPPRM